MTEEILEQLHSTTGVLTPDEACQLLVTISQSVHNTKDHLIVDLVYNIVKSCEVSAGAVVSVSQEANSQEIVRPRSYKNLKTVIESGISPIQNLIYKVDDMGFTSIGKELEIKIKLETIAEILTGFNTAACVAGRSTQATWLVQERIDGVTKTLIKLLKVKYRYKKLPKNILWKDRLWLKLSRTSVKDIVCQAADAQCFHCSNRLVNLEFAILDSCSDLFCTDCAHRLFNRTEESRIACPACRSEARSYTLARDFHHFKRNPPSSVFRSLT